MGEPIWTRTYGGPGVDVGVDVEPMDDGFILLGQTSNGDIGGYDLRLIRIDASGEVLWQNDHGTTEWDLVEAIDISADHLFLTGRTYGHGCSSGCAFVMKLDMDGDEVWTYTAGGGSSSHGRAVTALSDGTAVMAGTVSDGFNDKNGLILKVNADGDEAWFEIFGGSQDDELRDLIATSSDALVAVGSTRSMGDFENAWLVSVDQEGSEIWQRDFGAGAADASLSAIVERSVGGFAVTGYNTLNLGERDMILTVLDHEGWFQFGSNYGNGHPADGHDLFETFDGGYVVSGWAEGYGPGIRAAYVVRTDSALTTTSLDVTPFFDPVSVPTHHRSTFSFHPNPVTAGSVLNIKTNENTSLRFITLTDLSGRVVAQERCTGCNNYAVPQLARGVYHITVEFSDGIRIGQPLLID